MIYSLKKIHLYVCFVLRISNVISKIKRYKKWINIHSKRPIILLKKGFELIQNEDGNLGADSNSETACYDAFHDKMPRNIIALKIYHLPSKMRKRNTC